MWSKNVMDSGRKSRDFIRLKSIVKTMKKWAEAFNTTMIKNRIDLDTLLLRMSFFPFSATLREGRRSNGMKFVLQPGTWMLLEKYVPNNEDIGRCFHARNTNSLCICNVSIIQNHRRKNIISRTLHWVLRALKSTPHRYP